MAEAAATPTPGEVHLPPITAKAILLGNGPRFARDAFGPVLAFYVLWKLWGLIPGIVAATVVALVAYRYERKQDRPALVVRIALAFVLIQAVVGLWTGSAEIYLAIPVFVNAGYGLVVHRLDRHREATRRGLRGRDAAAARRGEGARAPTGAIFGQISLAWGAYMVSRSVLRLIVLAALGVDVFVARRLRHRLPDHDGV